MVRRFVPAALAVVAAALVPAAGQAQAQAGGYYTATPVVPIAAPRVVIGSGIWTQQPGGILVAPRAPERDAVLCRMVARKVGALAAFTAGGRALDPAALAACNVRAKGGSKGAAAE